jgi:hypothetical protein
VLYLLDADSIITGDRLAYPLRRFPVFWEWLYVMGVNGHVKIPLEQYQEIVAGRGDIVSWIRDPRIRDALLLTDEAVPELVTRVTLNGYGELDEDEVEQVGRDPFLISYALSDPRNRTVVTFETSAPGKTRANRKIPDVCTSLGVPCCTLYTMMEALDFTTTWQP